MSAGNSELHYPDGSRVHCGTVMYVKIRGVWMWARYEMTGDGIGYFIFEDDQTINASGIDGIEWRRS
jgi:hypothetical protein